MSSQQAEEIRGIIEEIYFWLIILEYGYGVCKHLAEVGKTVAKQMLEELNLCSPPLQAPFLKEGDVAGSGA